MPWLLTFNYLSILVHLNRLYLQSAPCSWFARVKDEIFPHTCVQTAALHYYVGKKIYMHNSLQPGCRTRPGGERRLLLVLFSSQTEKSEQQGVWERGGSAQQQCIFNIMSFYSTVPRAAVMEPCLLQGLRCGPLAGQQRKACTARCLCYI